MSTTREQEFDRFASDYQQVLNRSIRLSGETGEYFAAVKAKYLSNLVGESFSGTVLDYGCGVGLLSGLLKNYLPAARIDGYDVSAASIERVDRTLAARGRFTSEMSELRENYDVVIISNVMHHVQAHERQATISALQARLARLGKLVMFEHNPRNPLTRWAVSHCPFDEGVRLLMPKEALAYFEATGLKVLRRDYIVFFPRPLAWLRYLESKMCWIPFGAQYALVGEQDG